MQLDNTRNGVLPDEKGFEDENENYWKQLAIDAQGGGLAPDKVRSGGAMRARVASRMSGWSEGVVSSNTVFAL